MATEQFRDDVRETCGRLVERLQELERDIAELPVVDDAVAAVRSELRVLAEEVWVMGDYARRVLAGQQPTDPRRALEHIAAAAAESVARVTSIDLHNRRPSPAGARAAGAGPGSQSPAPAFAATSPATIGGEGR